MSCVIIIILISAFLIVKCIGIDCIHINALTYHLFHANIFHLIVNCLSFWFMYNKPYKRPVNTYLKELPIAFIVASLSFFIAFKPIVGISNILFAVIGLRTPAFSHPWWKSKPAAVFFIVTALTAFLPNISAITHIFCFVAGVLIALICRTIKSLRNDSRRALGR